MFIFAAMTDHFIRLFNYDLYANKVILCLMSSAPQEHITGIMAHTLYSQQVWLKRCKGMAPSAGPIWPGWPLEALGDVMAANHEEWLAFLTGLKPADFEQILSYTTTQGLQFQNKLIDIITHVVNHGTHHRAQMGMHLKAAGIELPLIDYILYIRELDESAQ